MITITVIARVRAKRLPAPIPNQNANVPPPTKIAIRVKYVAARSASLCTGGLDAETCSNYLIICATAVSSPILVTFTIIAPSMFRVPPITLLSFVLDTGIDSPVNIASLTEVSPPITTPSMGIFSPGLTSIESSMVRLVVDALTILKPFFYQICSSRN